MGTIITIVLICVCVGAVIGFMGSGKGERAAGAVEGGAQMGCASMGCMLQIAVWLIPILGVIWLFSIIFG